MIKSISALITVAVLIACGNRNGNVETVDKSLLPTSSGKYGEVLIVVDTFYENRSTGEALNKIFHEPLVGLPQEESQFRASTVPVRGFQSILKRSRNILKLSIGNGKKTGINIEENIWAKDQLMIHISAGSDEKASIILNKNVETIRNYFNEKELERLRIQYLGKPQKEVMDGIKDNYRVEFLIPPGFVEMAKNETGFWLKKEKRLGEHQIMQGITVSFRPYLTDSIFNFDSMLKNRNGFTKEMVQGTKGGSFMVVYEDLPTTEQEINLNGFYAKEYRGLWNMTNDFMGGPFLHYTLVDEKNNRVIELDAFVYAPKFEKREYLRELEAMLKTIKFN